MKLEQKRLRDAKCRRKLDRAAQWMKERLIESIHGEFSGCYPRTMPSCHQCGSFKNLQPDHVNGKAWKIRSTNQVTRILRYVAEFQAGVELRVLCKKCNSLDGSKQAARGHRVKHSREVPL